MGFVFLTPFSYSPVLASIAVVYLVPTTSICAEAAAISCNSAAVSSMAVAPLFSASRCSFVVPGIGTIHGFFASTQARAICAGVAFFCSANWVYQIQ